MPNPPESSNDLRRDVFLALDNAVENGYSSVFTASPLLLAEDLALHDAGLEDVPIPLLETFAREWQASND